MGSAVKQRKPGAFFRPQPRPVGPRPDAADATSAAASEDGITIPGLYPLAFAGIYLFTLVLYIRPNELFPAVFGSLPIAKVVAILTPALYIAARMGRGKLITWTIELKMAAAIAVLGLLHLPLALVRQDTFDVLFEVYFKVIIILALLIRLVDTRRRLRSLIYLGIGCCTWMALDAVKAYSAGDFYKVSSGLGRIAGAVGGIFSNPNDLATMFAMLLPLSVAFAMSRKGIVRLIFFAAAAAMGAGVVVSFSRGGFLGLIAAAGLMVWKFRRRSRLMPVVAVLFIAAFLALAMPGGFGDRMSTIFDAKADKTTSSEGRSKVMKRAAVVAARRALAGVGMGNFHHYSFRDLKAHNAYLEIAAELGALGLLAYLIMIFAPLRPLRRIERQYTGAKEPEKVELYYLSVGLQGTFVAYYVCSFFASIEYLWFIYYPIAYAIALRRIAQYEERAEAEPDDGTGVAEPNAGRARAKGMLWRLQQKARSPLSVATNNQRRGSTMAVSQPAFEASNTEGAPQERGNGYE